MRLAVISDIHGNLEAFDQVVTDIERLRIDEIICLGDNIGYGPDSEAVVQKIQRLRIPSLMGNHELAVAVRTCLDWFNPLARKSLVMTIDALSEESMRYVCNLNAYLVYRECRFVHGFPPDSLKTYLFEVSEGLIQRAFQKMTEKICFIGHTHMPALIEFDGQTLKRKPFGRGTIKLNSERQYIVNIGSVGQPRDGDNHAKYVIWDSEKDQLDLRFVSYDIARVVNKILAANLPKEHALRLW
jgi:predicted phosphodiesterase